MKKNIESLKTGLGKIFHPTSCKHVPVLNATSSGVQGLPLGSWLLPGPMDSVGYGIVHEKENIDAGYS